VAWLARAGGQPGVQRLEGLALQRGGGGLGRADKLALFPPRDLLFVAVAVAQGPLEEGRMGRKEEARGEREGELMPANGLCRG